jgi:hypothetical protein
MSILLRLVPQYLKRVSQPKLQKSYKGVIEILKSHRIEYAKNNLLIFNCRPHSFIGS